MLTMNNQIVQFRLTGSKPDQQIAPANTRSEQCTVGDVAKCATIVAGSVVRRGDGRCRSRGESEKNGGGERGESAWVEVKRKQKRRVSRGTNVILCSFFSFRFSR